jgi:uncharacterized membrane protein (DUF106 family)
MDDGVLLMSLLDTIFNPWLGQVLHLPSFFAILVISLFITLLVTIVYKYTTNQSEMKRLKEDLKKYQKEMRETKDTKKLMEIQKKSLDLNMKYMMASFKSTLYTFIPIIIIFAWLNMHIAYEPLLPGQEFKVTAAFADNTQGNITMTSIPELTIDSPTKNIENNEVYWKVSGDAGEYKLTFSYNGDTYDKNILITNEKKYEQPQLLVKNSHLQRVTIGNKVIHPFGDSFNLFGWYPGWLATYIVLSIGLSTLFRKIFKVY